jgi:hypothetical protein
MCRERELRGKRRELKIDIRKCSCLESTWSLEARVKNSQLAGSSQTSISSLLIW